CIWAGCTRSAPVVRQAEVGPYVGAGVCAECHAEIFKKQSQSPHGQTLRPAEPGSPEFRNAERVKLRHPQNGLEYRLEQRDGQWRQIRLRDGQEEGAAPIHYLLGSGAHGVSAMTRDSKGWRYLMLTYYAHGGWDVSPMHGLNPASLEDKGEDGWPVAPGELQKCWSCHSTRLEFAGSEVAPERSELGVRCESCHGPGRAHVEAVRAKSSGLAIQNPATWSADSFAALCQQCHNETATVEGTIMGISDDPADPNTVKYHVHGMKQSACFRKSGGEFSCLTCHDPHDKSNPNPAFYEARCVSCHRPETAGKVACSAGHRTKCLTCHMPKVEVAKYTRFADHWIRARSPFVDPALLNTRNGRPAHGASSRSSR
ncbi:MAG: multiheme c-type cytochrome, partial [Actinomycetota bacterium]